MRTVLLVAIIFLPFILLRIAFQKTAEGIVSMSKNDTGSTILSLITFALIIGYFIRKANKQNK